MRLIMAMIATAILAYAYADSPVFTKYDSVYADCIDYGHSPKTEEQKSECHELAKSEVINTFQKQQEFSDCMDYGHSKKSLMQEVSCLRKISK